MHMEEKEYIREVVPLRDRMYRYAHSLLCCAEEAEDAVHDLLERMWRERDRQQGLRSREAFVMICLRNSCYDRLRRRRAELRRTEEISQLTDRTAVPAERWEARDLVRRAMARLPERQREVLHLKDIEGYSSAEIARMTGYGEASLRMILSRARRALRDELEKME